MKKDYKYVVLCLMSVLFSGMSYGQSDIQIGSGTSTQSNFPFGGYYEDVRTQIIWTSSELSTAGLVTNGTINKVKFRLGTKSSTAPYEGFTIKMAHTTTDEFTASFLSEAFVTVKDAHSFTSTGDSWNTITLDQNFIWNGTDNIIMQLCYDNTDYTLDDEVRYATNANYVCAYRRVDGDAGCSITAQYRSKQRPHIKFRHQAPTTTTWTGGTSTDWNTASNWDNGVPGSTSDVIIASGTTYTCTFDESSDFEILGLTVNSGATFVMDDSDHHIEILGDLENNGTITHNGSEYFIMSGAGSVSEGGSATNTNLKIQATGGISLGSSTMDIYDLDIASGGSFSAGANTLEVYKLDNDGTLITTTGTIQIEGAVGDVDLTTGTLTTGTGTVHFKAGDNWTAVNQTVPSTSYYNLQVSAVNGYTVTVGSGSSFAVDNTLTYDNPGTAGGVITSNNDISSVASFVLGNTGNALTLNLGHKISGSGTVTMGNVSGHAVNVTYASTSVDVISGLGNPTLYGTVTYNSGSAQKLLDATYNNLTLSGVGAKNPSGDLDVNGDLSISSGATLNTSGTASDEYSHGSGTSQQYWPFEAYWEDHRCQIIYTAAELSAAGLVASDDITGIQFNVATKYSTEPIEGYTVKLAHTSDATFSSATFKSETFTTCRNSAALTTTTGWNLLDFDTDFAWDGSSNLLIEICFDDDSYTDDDYVYCHTQANTVCYAETDGSAGCSLSAENTSSERPNIKFNVNRSVTTNVNLAGDWSNSGTFTYGTSKVTLDGGSSQDVSGTTTFYQMDLNNSSGASISSGTQTIDHTLYLTDGTLTTGGNLEFVSDADGTARIDEIQAGAGISGDILFRRYISASSDGWRMLSSPVSGRTINDWDDDFVTAGFPNSNYPSFSFNSVYTYDETVTGEGGEGYTAPSDISDALTVGTGFYAYMGSGARTIDVTGPANTGSQSCSVSFTDDPAVSDTDHDGWNLVGNPYPSAIDWDAASGWTKTNIDNAVYVYSGDNSQFASYVNGVGTNGGSRYIASSQGFIVHANASSPVLSMTEAVKSTEDATFHKSSDPVLLRINMHSNTLADDEFVVRFHPDGDNSFQSNFDAGKVWSQQPSQVVTVTTELNNSEYSINTVSDNESNQIPVNIYVPQSGSYSLNVTEMPELPNIKCLVLKDLQTGDVIDLMKDTLLDFSANPGDANPRFVINAFQTPEFGFEEPTCSGDSSGIVQVDANGPGPWELTLTNLLGDTVFYDSMAESITDISNLNGGTYVVLLGDAGCGDSGDTVILKEPMPISASFETSDDDGSGVGEASVEVSGGTAPYSYEWDDDLNQSSMTATGLLGGSYGVVITDANGCSLEDVVIVGSTVGIEENENFGFTLYPSPVQSELHISWQNEHAEGEVELFDLNGKLLHAEQFFAGTSSEISIEMSSYEYGTYLVVIKLINRDGSYSLKSMPIIKNE